MENDVARPQLCLCANVALPAASLWEPLWIPVPDFHTAHIPKPNVENPEASHNPSPDDINRGPAQPPNSERNAPSRSRRAPSVSSSCSTLLMEWITVEWSRPPKW